MADLKNGQDVEKFLNQVKKALKDTKNKYDQRQALGGIISFFIKRNVS